MSNLFGYINGLTLNFLLRRPSKGERSQEANLTAEEPLFAFVPPLFSTLFLCVFFFSPHPIIKLLWLSFFPPWMQGLFKMITFVDKTTSGRRYLHIQPSENDVDGEETKLPVRNPITSLCKPNCVRGLPSLPWWSKENLKTSKVVEDCSFTQWFSSLQLIWRRP